MVFSRDSTRKTTRELVEDDTHWSEQSGRRFPRRFLYHKVCNLKAYINFDN